jgi:hypothetical protein
MPWVESHTVLRRHRKTIELAQDLRLKPVYAMGHLHALWHVALEQQEDGDLSSWSDDFLAASADYDGDVLQFVSLLQRHGFLDGRLIHDWLDYAGRYLEAKYRTSNPKRLAEIYAKHAKIKESVSSQSLVGPPDLPNQPLPLTPQAGPHRLTPREARQNPRALGINPRALAARAASAAKKYVEPKPPDEEDVMTAEDFAKIRQTLRNGTNGEKHP